MNKFYKLVLCSAAAVICFFNTIAKAQQSKVMCGDEIIKQKLEEKYPGYNQAVDNTFNEIANIAKNQSSRSNNTYTVNVVVHVVYKNPEENIADSIIQSQIDVLNEDFNRLNPDTGNLRALFKPIAASANIHFNLAQVKRKSTTQTFNISLFGGGMPNQMKWDSLGGSTAVDPDHYLNIWVCKIQPITLFGLPVGQVLGFAFPPANLSNWPASSEAPVKGEDGVVIDFRCFGRNNPNPISVDGTNNLIIKGRTPTHEVGHYLGLRHIWGDGGGLGGGSNNCTGSDGIADTPKANNQSNFDCNTTKNTCVDTLNWTTIDAPDLIENFMDYSSESCMNMFTAGQCAHMRATLEGPRNGLINPLGLNNVALFENNTLVYPNPAQTNITVSTLGNNLSKAEIINVLGKSISVAYPTHISNEIKIDITDLTEGTYFVKATSEQGLSTTKKILVIK